MRDFWREGWDAYEDDENADAQDEAPVPDGIAPRKQNEWREGWWDAAAEGPNNDRVSPEDRGIAFHQVR